MHGCTFTGQGTTAINTLRGNCRKRGDDTILVDDTPLPKRKRFCAEQLGEDVEIGNEFEQTFLLGTQNEDAY